MGLLARALKDDGLQFNLRRVDTRKEFEDALESYPVDVILSDHALPQFNSLEAFKLYQEKGLSIPFILVTGTVSEEFAVNVLRKGVDDYILKRNLSRLPLAITNALNKHNANKEKIKAEKKLQRQFEELVKVNHELDSFVYNTSHNLRSPLLSILGIINLFKTECSLDEKETEYLQLITSSVTRLDNTLRDIIDYSQNSRNEIIYSKIQFAELISNTYDACHALSKKEQIKKEVSIEEHFPFYSDPQRIGLLMKSLIANSFKFSMDRTASCVRTDVYTDAKSMKLKVSDNGVGIKKEVLPNVFNMFFRGNERSNGAGLGLYIAREIVNRLEGSIHIESTYGEGTTVSVEIPNQPG